MVPPWSPGDPRETEVLVVWAPPGAHLDPPWAAPTQGPGLHLVVSVGPFKFRPGTGHSGLQEQSQGNGSWATPPEHTRVFDTV